ncbi:PAS domain-containing sensor histidine kinase [Devosia submarina]|uniref:sensor histidine kinase n=1 Tax=Devosia submarina TaxID=1173082 RepID=UPI000D3BBB1A|nr:PAS domain-containing sensor histidine kinase [Devosia submarina]
MRSAESSGAGADGFGAGKNALPGGRSKATQAPAHRSSFFRHHLSPVTAAVGLTALLAAALFTLYDIASVVQQNANGAARTKIASPAPATDPVSSDLATMRFAAVKQASLLLGEGGMLGAASLVSPLVAARRETASLENPSWIGIAQRSGMAFAIAGLLTLLTCRPRKGGMPDFQQRHSYRTLASAIPLGVACWTRSGELVVCNDQYRERLNLGNRPVTYHDVVKGLIVGGYMKLINDDDKNRLLELHREDGSCLLIDERPLEDGGFMTLISDVTERKKTDMLLNAIREEQRLLARRYHEEKLKAEAASRSKTNFLAHLSHDIRTPLNHIIGFAELMRHQTYGPLGDPRYAEYVQSIKASGEHLLASFAAILDLAELDSGQKALRSDPVAVDQVMASVVQRFRAQAERAGITFQLGESCGAIVCGDRLGLTRMLSNVVENSLRFTKKGGRITLAGFAARDGVVIEVTDTGIGMDEERLASLSQPFALGDATFTRDGVGPGLGISISRAIAELTGGHMAIDSSPSLGTTVAFSLPLHAEQHLQAAE